MTKFSSTHPTQKLAFTLAEVVTATGMGKTSIYKEIKEGRLPAVKAGRRTLIPVAAVNEWLAALPAS